MTGAELTTDSEAKPSKLPRLDTASGTMPATSSSTPAAAVHFRPSTAIAATRTKVMTARIGPCWSSKECHPCGFTANQMLTPITATVRTAKT
jgi:hypothetical protein